MPASRPFSTRPAPAAVLVLALLAGCAREPAGNGIPGAGAPPPEVAVVTAQAQSIPLSTELPGRLNAFREAEIKARVPGVILEQVAASGSQVRRGDVLFRLDPAPLQAALASAQAQLRRAEAAAAEAAGRAARYRSLVSMEAVSRQEFESAQAAAGVSGADVAAARAAVQSARINLGYATVRAPFSGRLGIPAVTEGALVGQGEVTTLVTLQQLDPLYLDIKQSSADLLRLRRSLGMTGAAGGMINSTPVELVLEDGSVYAQPARLLVSEAMVDEATGSVTLRASVPNPGGFLLPGMYARARIQQGSLQAAFLVPQRAVARGAGDTATVLVVAADNKVEERSVRTEGTLQDRWIVSDGLQSGDRIIVEGVQKAKPGSTVKPVPFLPAAPAPATPN